MEIIKVLPAKVKLRRLKQFMLSRARRILVINGKGGCGKTTIATNLAVTFSALGHRIALMDNDPQGSSAQWAELRPERLPAVNTVASHQRPNMYQTSSFHNRVPNDTEIIIVDGHSNARGKDLDSLLRQTDLILVPILPSSIDIRAGSRFITDLVTNKLFRIHPRPIGVIANRVQPNTENHYKLMNFLSCLDVPAVAQFRDSPVYVDAAEEGLGIMDMIDIRAARKEAISWKNLVKWINSNLSIEEPSSKTKKAKQPLAASRNEETAHKDQPTTA